VHTAGTKSQINKSKNTSPTQINFEVKEDDDVNFKPRLSHNSNEEDNESDE